MLSLRPLAPSDPAMEADDEISTTQRTTSNPASHRSSKQSRNSSRNPSRTSSPRKHGASSRVTSPKHLPVDADPSQSQLTMDKLVLIHEQRNNLVQPSAGYSSSDYSLKSDHQNHLKPRGFFKENETKSPADDCNLHIRSPLQFHLSPELNAMSVTVAKHTIIRTYAQDDDNITLSNGCTTDNVRISPKPQSTRTHRRPPPQHIMRNHNKRKIKSAKVRHVKSASALPRPKSTRLAKRKAHHQTPEHVLTRPKSHRYAPPKHHHNRVNDHHENTKNERSADTRHVLPLLPSDSEVYGGPSPYFIKRVPKRAKRGATLNPISPAQSKDPYEANVAFNDWFAGHSQSNLVIETHKKIIQDNHSKTQPNSRHSNQSRSHSRNSHNSHHSKGSSKSKHSKRSAPTPHRHQGHQGSQERQGRGASHGGSKHRSKSKSRYTYHEDDMSDGHESYDSYHRTIQGLKINVNAPKRKPLKRTTSSPQVKSRPQNYHIITDANPDATPISVCNSTVLY
eukprot:93944_1